MWLHRCRQQLVCESLSLLTFFQTLRSCRTLIPRKTIRARKIWQVCGASKIRKWESKSHGLPGRGRTMVRFYDQKPNKKQFEVDGVCSGLWFMSWQRRQGSGQRRCGQRSREQTGHIASRLRKQRANRTGLDS